MPMSEMIAECYRQLVQPTLGVGEKSESWFVVQEHQATSHHYDFRLRVGGHYLSWVLPKGPSLNPDDHRLAKETSLHSLYCEKREGRIPAGHIGAGGIIVWDHGPYRFEVAGDRSPDNTVLANLRKGSFRFTLEGEKLKGEWLLEHKSGKEWRLVKCRDKHACTEDVTLKNRSVISDRTLAELCRDRIAWIELKRFYVEQHPQERPVILVREGFVLDVNQNAGAWKITPGMTARAARSILVDGDYLEWKPEEYVERQKQWLDVCTDFSDAIEPYDQHSAFVDLSLHADPIAIAEDLNRAVSEKTRLITQMGIARTKWIAKLAVSFDESGLAYKEPREFVKDLPVSMLLPVLPEHKERLRFLGYEKIGEVAKIPFEVLTRQFGEQAYTIHQASKGGYYQAVEPVYPPNSLADRWVFSEAVDSSETILATCKEWAGRIGRRLNGRGEEGAKVKLTIEDEDGQLRVLSRCFSKPIRCKKTALTAMLLMLDGNLDRPVLSLRLQMPDLRKVKPFQGELLKESKDERRIHYALRQVRTVFGADSVQLASQIEEPRRVKVLREWKNAIGWR